MPAAVSISLDDREGTPVTHVFTPSGVDDKGVWSFYNNAIEETIGRESLTVRLTRGARNKVRIRFTMPVMATETINGVSKPVIVRTNMADVQFVLDESSTQQERDNLISMVANATLAAQATINSVLSDVEDIF